jgi:hypothetical protein
VSLNDLLFDMLRAGKPSDKLGRVRQAPASGLQDALSFAEEFNEYFKIQLGPSLATLPAFDSFVDARLLEGIRDPRTETPTTLAKLGVIFVYAIKSELGGEVLTRGATQAIHTSIWFAPQQLEVFPIHRLVKRYLDPETELVDFPSVIRRALSDSN